MPPLRNQRSSCRHRCLAQLHSPTSGIRRMQTQTRPRLQVASGGQRADQPAQPRVADRASSRRVGRPRTAKAGTREGVAAATEVARIGQEGHLRAIGSSLNRRQHLPCLAIGNPSSLSSRLRRSCRRRSRQRHRRHSWSGRHVHPFLAIQHRHSFLLRVPNSFLLQTPAHQQIGHRGACFVRG